MAPKPDRRPARTRKALLSALAGLILEHGYERLTVDDVVERANIGRSTLYAHFGGLNGMLKESLNGPSARLAELVDPSVVPRDLVALLGHFKDQRGRNNAFFKPPVRGLWVRGLADQIEPRLTALARSQGRPVPALPWAFIAVQVAEGQIALIANWLAMKATMPAAVIGEVLIATTRATVDSMASAVNTPRTCSVV